MSSSLLELRPAGIEDAPSVADLESIIAPGDERDPEMMTFWWTHQIAGDRVYRMIAERDGVARVFVGAGHNAWRAGVPRFGWIRVRIHPEDWTEDRYRAGVFAAEAWLRGENAPVSVARIKADVQRELKVLRGLGYADVRTGRMWRLDLVEGRERLLAAAERALAGAQGQGVRIMALSEDGDPDRMRKLYELDLETMEDIPKTVPEPSLTFDEWHSFWFDNPAIRQDRFWIAREGDAIVGMSVIGYPPRRGIPWTSFTCTARSVRGRGVARALKYATVAQAIALGARQIETQNDGENAPILHLNEEMGYRPVTPVIELHREL